MQRIALDLDGVLSNTHQIIRFECIKKWGYDILKPVGRYSKLTYFIKIPGVEEKHVANLVHSVIAEDWKKIEPYPDVAEALTLFYSYYDKPITIVTARKSKNKKIVDATVCWLDYNFPNIKFNVVYSNHDSKQDYLLNNKFDTFVEDRLKIANSVAKVIRRVYLINRPWNEERETDPKVIRVGSFRQAILSILEGV